MRFARFRTLVAVAVGSAGAAATLAVAAPAGAAPDPTCLAVAHHQDARHDGATCAVRTAPSLATRWTAALGGQAGYPLVAAGRVFVSTSNSGGAYGGQLWALDVRTGATVWGPIPLAGTYYTFSIAYDNGRVFVVNFDGKVTAYSAANGRQLWAANTEYFAGEPVVSGGVLYVHDAHSVFALSTTNGRRVWASPGLDGDQSAVAVDDTGVYVNGGCSYYKLALTTGRVVWSGNAGCSGGGGGTSYVSDGRFFETTEHNIVNATNGRVVGSFAGAPAFAHGNVYLANGTSLFAETVTTSVPVFSVTLPAAVVGHPVVAGDVVYVVGADRKLYGVDGATGAIVQTSTLAAAPSNDFAIGLGRVVVPTATGVTVLS